MGKKEATHMHGEILAGNQRSRMLKGSAFLSQLLRMCNRKIYKIISLMQLINALCFSINSGAIRVHF